MVGDSAIYTFGVHPEWENFVNTKTTGTPRQVARRALESADDGVTTWVPEKLCGNVFLSDDIAGMLYVGLDGRTWSTTWTDKDYNTYWQSFTWLKGDTRKCFDRIQIP